MLYVGTSFLVPLILEEATSSAIEQTIAELTDGTLAISNWTRREFSSLLAREVRMGGLKARAAKEADAQSEAIAAESFIVLAPNAGDSGFAKEYLQNYETGLRAGDALHLAVAKNNKAEVIYSLDNTLLKARSFGLPMSSGIRLP